MKQVRVNMAYEAIDRHAEGFRKNKVALYYHDGVRNEKYTFKEMKEFSNKAGNILRTYWKCEKRGPSFYFYA